MSQENKSSTAYSHIGEARAAKQINTQKLILYCKAYEGTDAVPHPEMVLGTHMVDKNNQLS